jgi:hypothetical protein
MAAKRLRLRRNQMRKAMAAAGAALIVTLAGCGETENPGEGNQIVQVEGPERIQQQLQEMPEGQRNAVFIRAIQDGGQECQHVEASRYVGTEQGFPVWNVRCDGGGIWKVLIANDATAQVISSAEDPELDIGGNGNVMAPAQ